MAQAQARYELEDAHRRKVEKHAAKRKTDKTSIQDRLTDRLTL